MKKPVKKKTYKREVAIVQLVMHWILVMFVCWIALEQPDRDLSGLVSMITGLAVWVYGFAGTAFGLDAWAKQVNPEQEVTYSEQPPEGFGS